MSGRVSTRYSQIWIPSARTLATTNNLRSQCGRGVPFTVRLVPSGPKSRKRVAAPKANMPIQIMKSVNFLQARFSRRSPNPAGISSTAKFRFSLPWKRSTMMVSAVPSPTRIVK